MSYSRIHYLQKVKKICELYNQNKVEDVPASVTFRKYVFPVYPMHQKTFYKMLGINYERELKQLAAKKAGQTQSSLFNS